MLGKILRKPQAVIGLLMIALVLFAALFAPMLAPHDPNEMNIMNLYDKPSAEYPLGTDEMGRCILSRLICGARASMALALPSLLFLVVFSTAIAAVCAYAGGVLDKIFDIVSNIFMAFPPFLIAATLVGTFESDHTNIVLSIVIAMWVWSARIIRTFVLSEKNKPYITTCRMSGCGETRILFLHVVPNILPHLIVYFSTGLAGIIIMISSYAFLGMGLDTGTAEWGAMFVNAKQLIFSHAELLIYPGMCILFAAAGFNLFGEALRDICQPKEV